MRTRESHSDCHHLTVGALRWTLPVAKNRKMATLMEAKEKGKSFWSLNFSMSNSLACNEKFTLPFRCTPFSSLTISNSLQSGWLLDCIFGSSNNYSNVVLWLIDWLIKFNLVDWWLFVVDWSIDWLIDCAYVAFFTWFQEIWENAIHQPRLFRMRRRRWSGEKVAPWSGEQQRTAPNDVHQ